MDHNAIILVVDDEPLTRRVTVRTLQSAGYAVIEAETGAAGIQQALTQRPDLILLDVQLPDIDGFQVCRRLKADAHLARTFIVLHSGSKTASEEQAEGLESGADGYITRAISTRELLARVDTMLRLKRAEDAVRENEELYRSIFEQAGAGICHSALDGTFLKANQRFCAIVGYTEAELAHMTFRDITHPDDLETDLAYVAQMLKGELASYTMEKRYWRKDGALVWVNLTVSLVHDLSGAPKHFIGVVEDITARKQAQATLQASEQRYRTLVQQISDGILVVNPEGIVQFANPAAQTLFGQPLPELAGSVFGFPVIAGQMSEIDLPRHNQAAVVEMRATQTDWENSPAFLVSLRDITDRKQAEEQLRAALAQREWLVRDTYHRVKNNLMVVENLLRFQADYAADATVQEMFKESRTRVRSMLLIHEKLHQSQDLTQVDFAAYLRKLTVDLFRAYQSPAVPVELIVEVEDIFLSADTATSCGLIINELVSNALKHAFSADTPAGNKLWVSLQTEGDRYVLSVRDNGKGFPADKDFQNTDSLGMQIVTMKVHDLGGKFELLRDGGTMFKITFAKSP